jgi:hypothetical protein
VVCYLSLEPYRAKETREGEVYYRLLTKLEIIHETFKGRVFDILGEVFEEKSLKHLLLKAIRLQRQAEVPARLITRSIDTQKRRTGSHLPKAGDMVVYCADFRQSTAGSPFISTMKPSRPERRSRRQSGLIHFHRLPAPQVQIVQ